MDHDITRRDVMKGVPLIFGKGADGNRLGRRMRGGPPGTAWWF